MVMSMTAMGILLCTLEVLLILTSLSQQGDFSKQFSRTPCEKSGGHVKSNVVCSDGYGEKAEGCCSRCYEPCIKTGHARADARNSPSGRCFGDCKKCSDIIEPYQHYYNSASKSCQQCRDCEAFPGLVTLEPCDDTHNTKCGNRKLKYPVVVSEKMITMKEWQSKEVDIDRSQEENNLLNVRAVHHTTTINTANTGETLIIVVLVAVLLLFAIPSVIVGTIYVRKWVKTNQRHEIKFCSAAYSQTENNSTCQLVSNNPGDGIENEVPTEHHNYADIPLRCGGDLPSIPVANYQHRDNGTQYDRDLEMSPLAASGDCAVEPFGTEVYPDDSGNKGISNTNRGVAKQKMGCNVKGKCTKQPQSECIVKKFLRSISNQSDEIAETGAATNFPPENMAPKMSPEQHRHLCLHHNPQPCVVKRFMRSISNQSGAMKSHIEFWFRGGDHNVNKTQSCHADD